MFILKIINFRLLLYIGFILCIILVTTNPYWYDYLIFRENVISMLSEDNSSLGENITKDVTNEEIKISEIYPNCGLKYMCPDNTFPVHIYTGQDKDDQPKLCILGKYLGGGGRGLNIAVIESRYLQLVSMQTFDLYSHNSSSLETWLENNLHEDDIIIAFTFDEASKELSKKAKTILYHLGSGKIQDLQYRSQWYMISQKGIDGFTPLETITYARNDHWGEVIDERICVPRKIEPLKISPDPAPRKNPEREKFCSISKELQCEDFCNPLAQHEPIMPSLLTNRSLIGNSVFSTPIIVIAGPSMSTLVLTLETLVYQPGIHSGTVFVLYHEGQDDVATLIKLFGFKPLMINSTYDDIPNYKIYFGLQYIHENYPKKKYAIVLEEGLILSPDFLFYLAQTLPILEKDTSLLGISSWNPYGYSGTSGKPNVAYRVEDFPGLGFLIRMDVFVGSMKNNMEKCCQNKTFIGWPYILNEYKEGHIIMPDISRVLRRPKDLTADLGDEFKIFTLPRNTNSDLKVWIDRPQDLVKDRYFQLMASLIQSSITIHLTNDDLRLCENKGNIAMKVMLAELKNKIFAVYYQEDKWDKQSKLKAHMKCFEIFVPQSYRPQNTYLKVARFAIGNNSVLLIESTSPFARNKLRL